MVRCDHEVWMASMVRTAPPTGARALLHAAGISLALFILNILCIYVVSLGKGTP